MVTQIAVKMKSVWVAFCMSLFASGAMALPAIVDYIIDGDTFACVVALSDDVNITVRVRMMNIDAPEIHGACDYEINTALRARERLAELLPVGSTVELKSIKDDKYLGRIDAYVLTPDGRDVGDILITDGLARRYSGGKRAPWCEN